MFFFFHMIISSLVCHHEDSSNASPYSLPFFYPFTDFDLSILYLTDISTTSIVPGCISGREHRDKEDILSEMLYVIASKTSGWLIILCCKCPFQQVSPHE